MQILVGKHFAKWISNCRGPEAGLPGIFEEQHKSQGSLLGREGSRREVLEGGVTPVLWVSLPCHRKDLCFYSE